MVFPFNVALQENKPITIISTPLNAYLPAGLELRIDGGGARRAAFETCNVWGCQAGFAFEVPLLTGVRRGNFFPRR
ncbi:invasion associated locus B family protein [Chelativorans salis]|uniref:Invasion associated locus B family protein n=1 Tax=Chelativorans salis TaxID=2978478 RepID=A0ABT2LX76_9HYPH|nr:invasion associated locus B family protein [Chelativorans sp. EGI FJ00035]MCT7377988.1 invasion associated locus B family protein [Chelativorans sp. EGI FJ00035]